MRIGSLFSGIGGLELGLERAGLGSVVWQVEKDAYCRRILARHWPEAERFDDVCRVGAEQLAAVDLICGGFPCQDLSDASRGRGRGINGRRSGLWRELLRIVRELRPRWAVVENVAGAAAYKWVPVVRRELHRLGYPSVPLALSASACGAPFPGDRVFIAAADCNSQPARPFNAQMAKLQELADTLRKDWGQPSSRALGMAHGVPARVDRLRALGNAVVPQCAEVVGWVIRELEAA